MRYLNYLALFILISGCTSGEPRQNIDDRVYQSSGVEQFFLPELPNWANFSGHGKCFKSASFHYLDFSKLLATYQLTYSQMLELQAQYNQRLEDYYRSTAVRFLKPIEQANLFSNTLEQVRGGVRQFKLPVGVGQVEVIWLESFLKNGKIDELKKLAASGRFDEKLPVLYSSCLSKQYLDQWLTENNLENVGFYKLSAEWLSPYGSDAVLRPGLEVNLKELFGPSVKMSLFSFRQELPSELILP